MNKAKVKIDVKDKSALFTKPVYIKDRGINISKAKVLEVDGFGKITMARVTIGDT